MADRSQEAVATSQATHSAATVGTTAASVASARESRVALLISNMGAATVYFGTTSGVTTSNGVPIAAGGSYLEEYYTGAVFMISGSAAQNVRLWEVG